MIKKKLIALVIFLLVIYLAYIFSGNSLFFTTKNEKKEDLIKVDNIKEEIEKKIDNLEQKIFIKEKQLYLNDELLENLDDLDERLKKTEDLNLKVIVNFNSNAKLFEDLQKMLDMNSYKYELLEE
jgi:predicted RND superfamily exporter protein